MLILKRIEISEGPATAALFYYEGKPIHKIEPGPKFTRTGTYNSGKTFCEILRFSAVDSVLLTENSINLRLTDRNDKRPRTLKLTLNSDNQIESVAQLVEHCTGQGLRVKEHFANISIKQVIKNQS